MPGTPNAFPSTTLAVFRPTPGSVTRSSSRFGTRPSNASTRRAPSFSSASDLARKKPVGRISSSSSVRSAAARSAGDGYRANSAGVTWLTRTSVVWAESTVATRSWNESVKSSSQHASG